MHQIAGKKGWNRPGWQRRRLATYQSLVCLHSNCHNSFLTNIEHLSYPRYQGCEEWGFVECQVGYGIMKETDKEITYQPRLFPGTCWWHWSGMRTEVSHRRFPECGCFRSLQSPSDPKPDLPNRRPCRQRTRRQEVAWHAGRKSCPLEWLDSSGSWEAVFW